MWTGSIVIFDNKNNDKLDYFTNRVQENKIYYYVLFWYLFSLGISKVTWNVD